MKLYVQYGCGLCAPKEWVNFDVSPSLKMQRNPLWGFLAKRMIKPLWPKEVRYGNILTGLPGIPENSVQGLYCSHVLEHLSLEDFRIALKESFRILAPGGTFRLVMPDLEAMARAYLAKVEQNDPEAAIHFINSTLMGQVQRPRGAKAFLRQWKGNAHHLWLWDRLSTQEELKKAGFSGTRECFFGDATDPMFSKVEMKDRFDSAFAIEATKA